MKKIFLLRISPYMGLSIAHPHDLLPPFSIGYIATVLKKKGYIIKIVDTLVAEMSVSDIASSISGFKPEVIIIESISSSNQIVKEICITLNDMKNIRIICIGHYASTLPYDILNDNPSVNICVVGEPESPTIEVIDALATGTPLNKVKGIVFRDKNKPSIFTTGERAPIQSLETLPPINYRLLPYQKYRVFSVHAPIFKRLLWGFLLTSRGCPYECIFCSSTLRQSYGKKYRALPPDTVVNQIAELVNDYKINIIAFQDDDFCFDKNRIIAICENIIKRNIAIKWVIQTRPDKLDDEILSYLKKAGCVCIALGVESGSERILKVLKKDISKPKIRDAFKKIHSFGIATTAFFMIGNPSETLEEMQETLSFAHELSPLIIQVAYFTAYPGSTFYDELKETPNINDIHHYDRISINPSNVSDEDIASFRKKFYKNYYFSMKNLFRYCFVRAPFAFLNNDELRLIVNAIPYLFKHDRNIATKVNA